MITLGVPTPWVLGDYLPATCTRHGAPATSKRAIAITSRTPVWVYLLLPALLIFLIVFVSIRRTVPAAAWPFCPACASHRRKTIAAGCALVALAALLFGIAVALDPSGEFRGLAILPLLACLATVIAAIVTLARSAWTYTAQASVTADRQTITVTAHETFAEQLQTALTAAAAAHTTTQTQR